MFWRLRQVYGTAGEKADKGYGFECNNMDGCTVDHHQLSKQLQLMNQLRGISLWKYVIIHIFTIKVVYKHLTVD